jgi:hypothetical protein
MKERSNLPSPALIVAVVALVVATTGAAVALPGKNSVKSDDIAKNAVKKKHIKKGNVVTKTIKRGAVKASTIGAGAVSRGKLAANSVDGSKVADGALGNADIGDYALLGDSPVRVAATEGASFDAARAAAPETPLFEAGSVELYAKCLRDTTAGAIRGEIYARTSANGAMMEGDDDLPGFEGTAFLDTATAEADRQLDTDETTVANTATYNENEGLLTSAEGRAFHVLSNIGVKQGSPAGGNGPFGAGNTCLFGGSVFG